MDLASFMLSLGTWFVVFVILLLIFTWASTKPAYKAIYFRNRIGSELMEGGSPNQNRFSWVKEALSSSSTDKDVIATSAVDSAVYFVFLSTMMKILFISGIVLLPFLLPLAATENINRSSVGTFNCLDRLSMAPVKQKTMRLWAFVAATYWVSVVAYFVLWKAYKHVSDMRAAALSSPQFRPEQFVVLVRDIPLPPSGQTRKELVDSFFTNIYPDKFYKSLLVTDNIEKLNKIYKDLEGCKKKLAQAESELKKISYQEKINNLSSKLEAEQKSTSSKQQPSALVFFTSRVTAASAAQCLHGRMPETWTVTDAPGPNQIIWPNLSKTLQKRQKRKYVICAVTVLTLVFYMGLVLVISALSILHVGTGVVKTVFWAYIPHTILIIAMALLSKFLSFLSKSEGIPSKSHAAWATSVKFFYFTALVFFAGFTVSGAVFESIDAINNEQYNTYGEVLGESLPTNAIFFMTFVALKFFVGYGIELSRIVPLIRFHLTKKHSFKTRAEIEEECAPREFEFESKLLGDMFIVTIVIGYSVIAPIIIPFGAIYFALGWLVLRNQVLKVYVRSHETYGKIWPLINTQIVAALFVFQFTMFTYFDLKKKFAASLVVIPLPVISILFDYVCRKKYNRVFKDTALEAASCELNENPDMDLIFRSYVPPSLNAGKADEDHLQRASSHV